MQPLLRYDTGTISGIIAMKYWKDLFSTGYVDPTDNEPSITASQSSEIVSILSAGTFFGALLGAPVADSLGRRWALVIDSVVFCFGVALQTAATAIPLFVAGRFFAGLGVGMLSGTIPLYQSETAPKWIRGTIVGAYQLCIAIGLFIAAIVLNATKDRNDTGCYQIPVAVQFAFASVLVVGILLLPETPRYYVKRGQYDLAARSLARLRSLEVNDPAVVVELSEIQAHHEFELSLGSTTYLDCFRPPMLKRLLTGCGLQALQQLTGVNFIFYYGTSFFKSSGISNAFVISVIINVVSVCTTLPGLYMVEKWGRRLLLLYGAAGMAVCEIIVGSVATASSTQDTSNKVLIAFVCIYVFFFCSSWGPVAWVVTGEIFPLKLRAKCLSMTTASNWLLNWAIAYATPYLINPGPGNANLGTKVFFIWGGFCLFCVAFVFCCIYETRGLSLEQIDDLYDKVDYAWQSTKYVGTASLTGAVEKRGEDEFRSPVVEEANEQKSRSITHLEG